MRKFLLSIFISLSLFAGAQTAKVAQLAGDEATKAEQLHKDVEAANKAVKDYDEYLQKKYSFSDIEYSTDWKFIVPKTQVVSASNGCYTWYPSINTWLYTTPSTGSLYNNNPLGTSPFYAVPSSPYTITIQ